ncbi:hypothetical protein TCAL_10331, partial [Tigriopus californicus]
MSDLISAKQILKAQSEVFQSSLGILKTPCILLAHHKDQRHNILSIPNRLQTHLRVPEKIDLFGKLENVQNTGSFKIRGVANQLRGLNKGDDNHLVTMSAGNYGRTFATACKAYGFNGTVIMPESAPDNRAELMTSLGITVERLPTSQLMRGVSEHEGKGSKFLHPFDDLDLIAGYGSLGLEILEDVPDADIVLVCCGGGGLLAGVATSIKLFSKNTDVKVYGVEPEIANGMFLSIKRNSPAQIPSAKSIASGLAPPFAGSNAFAHVKKYCDGVLLVSDLEIKQTVCTLFESKLVVEPSGSAALAAVLCGKLQKLEPDLAGKKVVAIFT